MKLIEVKERWSEFAQSARGQVIRKQARIVAAVGVIAYLVYRISDIGWSEVWASRPHNVLYFLILPVLYLSLPIAEGAIYRRLWNVRRRDTMVASLKKRTLNTDVLNYSGEVQFYLWAKRTVPLAPGRILRNIKDNLIVSSIASIISAAVLLGMFIAFGQVDDGSVAAGVNAWHVGAGVTVAALLVAAVAKFRTALFSLSASTLGVLLVIHIARFIGGWALLIVQWWSVLPNVSFQAWAVLLTTIVLVDRIPLLPSKDLVLAGVGIELSSMLNVPAAAVAGLFLVRSAFDRTLNVSLFAASAFWKRSNNSTPEEDLVSATSETVTPEAQFAHVAS